MANTVVKYKGKEVVHSISFQLTGPDAWVTIILKTGEGKPTLENTKESITLHGEAAVKMLHRIRVAKADKVAKLVTFSIMTRIVAKKGTRNVEIIMKAFEQALVNAKNDGAFSCFEKIQDDIECPYDPGFDDKKQ